VERRGRPDGEDQPAPAVRAGALRLLYAGTPPAARPALVALLASRHEVLAVLTRPPAGRGRGRRPADSAVAELAGEHGLPVLSPSRPADPDFLDSLRALAPDCCPVVAYGALIPPAALAVPRHGWVNLHFSLLPAWRGAAPVQHAILHGDELTGASTFALEAGLDTGPVYGTVTEAVRPRDTAGELTVRLAAAGARLLVATLDGIEDGTLHPVPQAGDGVSHAPKLTPEEVRVPWSAPAAHVDRLVRAATPAPGAWTTFRGQRIKLGPVWPVAEADRLAPGRLVVEPDRVLVGTGSGPVRLGDVQPPGRRAMPAPDWARGARPGAVERFD